MARTRCSKAETRDFGLASSNNVETPLAEMTLDDLNQEGHRWSLRRASQDIFRSALVLSNIFGFGRHVDPLPVMRNDYFTVLQDLPSRHRMAE